ncbi:MAG: DUF2167 domain-containing protein [Bacteroidales bacterium]|nr:DUF2167 domain-containing protein [Bacteroidales bacterium]
MKKIILSLLALIVMNMNSIAQEEDSTELRNKEIENSLIYKTGVIELRQGNAKLTVPKGFRFLDEKQAMYVLTDLWGNPADSTILGLLVPANRSVMDSNGWVFTISFDEMGYVKDDDADDIDYDELLKEQQKETNDENPERIKEGYDPIDLVGWASMPFYDKDKKILHWAKELKFGEDSIHTLNYNLRILGRKGVFVLNAVASMDELSEVKSNINNVIDCVEFDKGHSYFDFDPKIDNVAAWTIGGLVAGKLLAKAGLFVLLLKFWKLIAVAVAGFGGGIWKYFKKKKAENKSIDRE